MRRRDALADAMSRSEFHTAGRAVMIVWRAGALERACASARQGEVAVEDKGVNVVGVIGGEVGLGVERRGRSGASSESLNAMVTVS
jgi:hypothetical protein